MTNDQITRTLAEKVMGWTYHKDSSGVGAWYAPGQDGPMTFVAFGFGWPSKSDVEPWSPPTNRNDLAEVLERLTPEQWFEVNRSLPTIYSIRSDASPRHGFSWWLLTCDPAIIARAVAEVVSK